MEKYAGRVQRMLREGAAGANHESDHELLTVVLPRSEA